jgi:hypothetical protein
MKFHLNKKEYDQAIADFTSGRIRTESQCCGGDGVALVHGKRGKDEVASADIEQAIRSNP